jgi:hypothetical protein
VFIGEEICCRQPEIVGSAVLVASTVSTPCRDAARAVLQDDDDPVTAWAGLA